MRFALLFALFITWLSCPAQAEVLVQVAGPEESVFIHDRDACQPLDIPDAPARAFRDNANQVHLFASHYINYAFIGPDLNSAKRFCEITFQGSGNDDPAAFNDKEWLLSFWTDDGKTINALTHNEFQANLRPWLCPSRIYNECWYNSVIGVVSHDGGFHFERAKNAIVAAPAYKFDNTVHHPVGYFEPSNIVKSDNYCYVMVWAENVGIQKRGVCLLRTNDINRPDSWRGWDGTGFSIRLDSPYAKQPEATPQVCTVVDPQHLRGSVLSLLKHTPSTHYIAVVALAGTKPGFYACDSTDLLHWSEPQFIMDQGAGIPGQFNSARAYPSIIDPNSPSRNFEVVGDKAYLYYTRFNQSKDPAHLDRDLMRVPVNIKVTN